MIHGADLIGREPDRAIYLPINPIAWKAPTAFARRMRGQVVAGTAPAPEVVTFQSAMRDMLDENLPDDFEPIDRDCRIDFYFSRRLETYVSATGRNITKHRQDLTNLRKSAEDALQPRVLTNDKYAVSGWTEIVEQSKGADPWIEIRIWVLG